jgi:hypothetical protein
MTAPDEKDWSGLLMIAALLVIAVVLVLACCGIGGQVS